MRIYIDGRCLSSSSQAGVARYTSYIISRLLEVNEIELVIISNRKMRTEAPYLDQVEFKEVRFFSWLPGSIFMLLLAPFFIQRDSLFLGANHCVPVWGRFKRVLVIHDFVYKVLPRTQTLINRFSQATCIYLGLFCAEKVAFVSRYSLEKFAELYPGFVSRSESILLSNRPDRLSCNPKSVAIDGDFIFALGSLEPRKNIESLVIAFEEIRRGRKLKLIVAGPKGWKSNYINRMIGDSDFQSDIHFLGYLTDDEVEWCFRNCSVFCYPSFYEGFGLPPFEALFAGSKVVGTVFSELKYFRDMPNLFIYDPILDDLAVTLIDCLDAPKLDYTFKSDDLNFKFDIERLLHD